MSTLSESIERFHSLCNLKKINEARPVIEEVRQISGLFRERVLEVDDSIEGKCVNLLHVGGLGDAIEQYRNIERRSNRYSNTRISGSIRCNSASQHFCGPGRDHAATDLVITIDSAPAHLAGALDVPVWNLLSQVADWRWGVDGQTSMPLYPSMRGFRQTVLGDWSPVIAEVNAALGSASHSRLLLALD